MHLAPNEGVAEADLVSDVEFALSDGAVADLELDTRHVRAMIWRQFALRIAGRVKCKLGSLEERPIQGL